MILALICISKPLLDVGAKILYLRSISCCRGIWLLQVIDPVPCFYKHPESAESCYPEIPGLNLCFEKCFSPIFDFHWPEKSAKTRLDNAVQGIFAIGIVQLSEKQVFNSVVSSRTVTNSDFTITKPIEALSKFFIGESPCN